MRSPNWFDQVVKKALSGGDPAAIAKAIAADPQFIAAVQKGLGDKPVPPLIGTSYAQNVADAIRDSITQLGS